jgi:hypothetical protein
LQAVEERAWLDSGVAAVGRTVFDHLLDSPDFPVEQNVLAGHTVT